jgi:hypothetical protein
MQALVLTYDKNQHVAAHAIACSRSFGISGEPILGSACLTSPRRSSNAPVNSGLRAVAGRPWSPQSRTLLADLPADEWVFWCMDDYFPLNLDLPWLQAMIPQLGLAGLRR